MTLLDSFVMLSVVSVTNEIETSMRYNNMNDRTPSIWLADKTPSIWLADRTPSIWLAFWLACGANDNCQYDNIDVLTDRTPSIWLADRRLSIRLKKAYRVDNMDIRMWI